MKYALTLGLFFLGGCHLLNNLREPSSSMPLHASPLTVWGTVEAVSYMSTGKPMTDNVASFITEKDCSIGRYFRREGKFCMTEFELEQANKPRWPMQKVYCYRTIANPVCYSEPSPNASDVLLGIYERPMFDSGR